MHESPRVAVQEQWRPLQIAVNRINFRPREVANPAVDQLNSFTMSEKPESDEFEDEEEDPSSVDEDVDLDQVTKELDLAKRRGQKLGDPAWRRLERIIEDKRVAELTSDFEDYDIGIDDRPKFRKRPQR